VTFSEPVAPGSVGVSLKRSDGSLVPSSVGVVGATVSVTPSAPLAAGATYSLSVAGTVTDLAGNPLGTPRTATFTVRADLPPATNVLRYSVVSSRANGVLLDGAGLPVSGAVYVFFESSSAFSRVEFWLDNPSMSGAPVRVESLAPWDYAGGSTSTANPLQLSSLSVGAHTITVKATPVSGAPVVSSAAFTVG
jgi:hypothetical protein